MSVLKLSQVGNSLGVIFPKDLLAKMKVGKGDSLYATETATGIHLSTYDPEFELKMTEARRIMKKRREVLRELAK